MSSTSPKTLKRSSRRNFLWAALMLPFCSAAKIGASFSSPESGCPQLQGRRIRWIVPNALGGGYDTYSRMIEPFLEETIGAEVVIENLPGAAGIVGARALAEAAADGLTVGILNAAGLLAASLAGETKIPNLVDQYSVLGRVSRSRQVWVASATSNLSSIEKVFEEGRHRPIIFGDRDLGSSSIVNVAVGAHLLGLNIELVTGYSGAPARALALMRGDVDIVGFTFESIRPQIESGELRVILQIDSNPISPHPALNGVPLLAGPAGWAVRRAVQLDLPTDEAAELAQTLTEVLAAGRVVVAPAGLNPQMLKCWSEALMQTLNGPDIRLLSLQSGRSLDVADGPQALQDLNSAAAKAARLIPILQMQINRFRQ